MGGEVRGGGANTWTVAGVGAARGAHSHSWREPACVTVCPAPCLQVPACTPAFPSETPARASHRIHFKARQSPRSPDRASPGSPRAGLHSCALTLRTGACATGFHPAPQAREPSASIPKTQNSRPLPAR